MAIAHAAGQSTGNHANNTTSLAVAFPGNITNGSLIVAAALIYSPSSDALLAGDLTKTAGTATIGTISLDNTPTNFQYNGDANYQKVGIYSALVTGTGSCTLTIAGAPAGSYLLLALDEFTGSWDSSRVESSSTNNDGTDNTASGNSGNVTSAGAALFIGGIAIGASGTVTITPDGAFTQIFEDQSGATDNVGSAIYQIVSTGTTDRAEWTLSTNHSGYSAGVVLYKEAAGGAAGQPTSKRLGGIPHAASNYHRKPNAASWLKIPTPMEMAELLRKQTAPKLRRRRCKV